MGRVYALAFHDWDSFLPFRARESLAPSLSREVVPSLTVSEQALPWGYKMYKIPAVALRSVLFSFSSLRLVFR